MIITRIIGGLGNQMFQLAFAETLRKINQTTLFLDISAFAKYKDRQYNLDCFDTNFLFAKTRQLQRFQEVAGKKDTFLKAFAELRYGKAKIIKENKSDLFHFIPTILKKYNQDLYLQGYWQSYKYFTGYEEDIRKLFTFKKKLIAQNDSLLQVIKSQSMISLHVRRGDYVANKMVQQFHGNCSLDYYQNAIQYIAQRISKPNFLIFSDDITWCKAHLKTGFPQTFVTERNADWEDMYLMSLCQHHIIANSSFSWWGAWLNPNTNKIVIAPKQWLSNQNLDNTDLLPKNWIKL